MIDFIYSYHTNRKQRTKVDSAVCLWEMLFSGVPQGSVLGPLLFNTYISGICFFKRPANFEFAGYADDGTPFSLHILFKYRKCARQSKKSIRKFF